MDAVQHVSIEIDAASAIDPDRDVFVTLDGTGHPRVRVFDLANPSAAPVSVTTTGDKRPEQDNQIGFEWDPVSKKFVAYSAARASTRSHRPPSNWKTGTWVWAQIAARPTTP